MKKENETKHVEIKGYRLIHKLGEGAAGVVWLALLTENKPFGSIGDPFAMKIYKSEILEQSNQLERIKREFSIGSQISHPNVCQIFDCIIENSETPYIVMEYVDGLTLPQFVQMYHPVQDKFLGSILKQLISSLRQFHEFPPNGTAHRDIKPSNIMITSNFEIKIMDFGVVFPLEGERLTPPGAKFPGTKRNSPPERLLRERHDEKIADLYSLGTVLYFLLHGFEIFHEIDSDEGLGEKIVKEEPSYDPTLESKSDVYNELFSITKKLLDKKPSQRYESLQAISDSLKSHRLKVIDEPLHGYIATALTKLEDEAKEAISFVSSRIAEVCKDFDIYVHQPRKATDPDIHKDIPPEQVYYLDRKKVSEADLIIVLANYPSFGVGQEIEIAGNIGTPTILIVREGKTISRMVSGGFTNIIGDITYRSPEDLDSKIRKCISDNIETIRNYKKSLFEDRAEQIAPLSHYREEAGYTIDQLAEKASVSKNLIKSIENYPSYYHNVGIRVLRRLCNALNLNMIDILELRAESSEPRGEDNNIIRIRKAAVVYNWSAEDYFNCEEYYKSEVAAKRPWKHHSVQDYQRINLMLKRKTLNKQEDTDAQVEQEDQPKLI